MPDRYWVAGGTGNYNSATNWSATSGGASGASVPTSADNVFFNASSGAGTATINVASSCANLNLTGFTGTLTFNNNLSVAGTVVNLGTGAYTVLGTAALRFQTASTITSNGSSWSRNITFAANGAFTLADNLTVLGTLSFEGNFTPTINGNTLNISGDLTYNSVGNTSGTTLFNFNGTGTWSHTNSGAIGNSVTINTVGTLTISGTVYKSGNTFTYTAGTVVDTGATVVISSSTTLNVSGKTWNKLLVNNTITLTSNINAVTFGTTGSNTTTFVLGGNTLNFTNLELGNTGTTTLPSAWSCQNLTFVNASAGTINGNSITINGNILQSGTGTYSGTTTFTYAGTGTWNRTSTGYFSNSFTINTAGTLTITGGNIGGGIFTYTAGTVVTTGGTLWNRVTGTTFNHGAIIFNNVVFGASEGSGSVPSVTLNNKLTCTGTLTLGVSNTTFAGTDGTFDVFNLILGTDALALRTTTLVSTKTYLVRQSFTCTQATDANRILMQSTIGGSKAIFTVFNNSTLNVGFVNATDIDSSLGKRIYSYRGVFSNTDNWALLPTDVKSATGVFVN